MTGVVRIVGTVASLVALVPSPIQPIAAAVAVAANVGAQLTAKKPVNERQGLQLSFKIDPNSPIYYPIGRTAVGGVVVHRETYGTDNHYQTYFVDLGLGPIHAIETFLADRAAVAFSGTQAIGYYNKWMWQDRQLGALPEGRALDHGVTSPPFGSIPSEVPGWSDQHKLSGHAAASLTMLFDTKARRYANGEPQPGWILQGNLVWDPRLDSTYPGGVGSCRRDDPSTWVYSETAALHGLKWRLGIYQNGKRIMGVGAPIDLIDVARIVEAANVQEANGWKVGGELNSGMDRWEALKLIDQAGGAEPVANAALMSTLQRMPRVAVGEITDADVVGRASIPGSRPRRERINGFRARFRSEAHGWEMVPIDLVQIAAYVEADGVARAGSTDYALVQDANQAAQLAAYEVYDSREIGPIELQVKPRFIGYRIGDALTANLTELGLVGHLVIVRGRRIDPKSGIVTLKLVTETTGKHAEALGRTGNAPPVPRLTYDPLIVAAPSTEDWSVAGGTVANSDGHTIPALIVTGAVANSAADGVVFDFRPVGASDWINPSIDAPDTHRKLITDVAPLTAYELGVRYKVAGVIGDRLVLPAVVTGEDSTARALDLVQVIAAGKNKTFLQPTAPTAAESAEGDTWWNSAGEVYRRGPGSGVLAIGGNRLTIGGLGVTVAPWLSVSDVRIAAAQDQVAKAQAAVAAILSDGILSRDEKRQFAREWNAAQASYAALDQKAAAFGNVAALRASLTTAYQQLTAAIGAITPPYDDFASDSPIDRATVESRWTNFYTTFAALDVAITAQTLIVQWSVTGAGGWHADYQDGDLYQRQSVDGGLTFTAPARVVGEDGNDGAPGAPGADGKSSYLHTAYANSADGAVDFTTGEAGNRRYLGVLVDRTAADSTNPVAYTWSLIKGADGLNGKDGTPGAPGADGKPTYVHIAYANAADGSVDFSVDDPAGRRYIGFYVDQTVADSTNAAAYAWSRAQGDAGVNGQRTSFVFRRAAAQPATPTADDTPPPNWSDAPPVQTEPPLPLWQSSADFRDGVRLTAWASPIKLTAASLADLDPVAAAVLAGKARIFRQGAAPLASSSAEGDLWFDTANGDAAYSRGPGSGVLAIAGNRLTIAGAGVLVAPWLPVSNPQAVAAAAAAAAARAIAEAASADGILTPDEKRDLLTERMAIAAEHDGLVARATAQGVSVTIYEAAYFALLAYLDTLALADRSTNTAIVPATHTEKLAAYYTARTGLLAAIGDLTAANQLTLGDVADIRVTADYTGAIGAGQLPQERSVRVYLGTADVTAFSSFVATVSGGATITLNNTPGSDLRGTITLTALSAATATIDVTVIYAGRTLYKSWRILREDAAPPAAGGGAGSGGAAGSPASTSNLTGPGAATTHQTMATLPAVTTGSGGKVTVTAPLQYTATSEGTVQDQIDSPTDNYLAVKAQYSTNGGTSFTDAPGGETTGSPAQAYFSITVPKGVRNYPGSLSYTATITGLASGASVIVRLQGRLAGGISIASVSGTMTAKPE